MRWTLAGRAELVKVAVAMAVAEQGTRNVGFMRMAKMPAWRRGLATSMLAVCEGCAKVDVEWRLQRERVAQGESGKFERGRECE